MGLLKYVFYPGFGCYLGYALSNNTYDIWRRNVVRAFHEESSRSSGIEASYIFFTGGWGSISEYFSVSRAAREALKQVEKKSEDLKAALPEVKKPSSAEKDSIIKKAADIKETIHYSKQKSDQGELPPVSQDDSFHKASSDSSSNK